MNIEGLGIEVQTDFLKGKTPVKGVDYFDGKDGADGKSAYQIWLEQGNEGTEQDFLDSLKGGANILYGKTIYSDGDSIAVGAGSNNVSYAHLLAEKYNMTLTSEAESGTTIAVQSNKTDSIYERVTAMTEKYDYILLDGGTNDVSQNIPIGTITTGINEEPDPSTILGALEGICKFLTLNYFSSKKLFIFVNSRYDILERTNATFAKMKEVLEKWGIPYIDIAKLNSLGYWNDTVASDYFVADKLHPTLKAYQEFYLPYVENALLYGGYINPSTSRNETGGGTLFVDSANTANVKEASYEYQRNGDWIDAHIYVEFNAFTPPNAYHSISLASLPYKCGNKITVRETCVTTAKKQMLWAIATGSATLTLLLFNANAFVDGEKLSFSIRYKASAKSNYQF